MGSVVANANINLRRREALKPELHSSYCHLCALSNPITTELFGDDLPKAVKDITDTNPVTSKLSREKLSRVSDGLRGKVTPIGTTADFGVLTLGRQKTTVARSSTRRRGRGKEGC